MKLLQTGKLLPICIKTLICIITSIIVISCTKGEDEISETSYLYIDSSTETINSSGGTINKKISSNDSWYIQANRSYDWIEIRPQSGFGDNVLVIAVSPNTSSSDRFAYYNVLSKDNSYTFCVRQLGGNGTSSITPPTGVSVNVSGSYVNISWNSVSTATKYNVYRSSSSSGNYSLISTVTTNSATDTSPLTGYNYYKIKALNNNSESEYSSYAYAYVSSGGGQQKPSAPTGVTVSNEGNNYIPDVRIRWNSVSGATKYYIYKSSYASGSYSKIGEMEDPYTLYADPNPPTNGESAYYKVKAVNGVGESDFSNYAKYTSTSNDEAFAPAYRYGSCTASGNTITLRWTNSSGYGYGKATEVILRVWNPYAEEWQDTKLSATATSASFNYSTKIDDYGYVKAGIVVSNAQGSFTAGAKVYDAKNNKWLN